MFVKLLWKHANCKVATHSSLPKLTSNKFEEYNIVSAPFWNLTYSEKKLLLIKFILLLLKLLLHFDILILALPYKRNLYLPDYILVYVGLILCPQTFKYFFINLSRRHMQYMYVLSRLKNIVVFFLKNYSCWLEYNKVIDSLKV